MDGQNCPKCGSNQVVKGQCLKCGIVISKFLEAAQSASEPVSYVAPSQAHKEYSYTISKDHVDYAERRVRDQRQRALVGIAIVVVIGAVVFLIWKLLSESASEYSGLYKNGKLIYGLYLPTSGPKWYHGTPTNLEKLGIIDPHDAFYRGENRDEPDVAIAVYVKPFEYVPEKMGTERQNRLLAKAEETLLSQMEEKGITCEIVDSRLHNVGGREGFLIEAEINRNAKIYRTFVLNGYANSKLYTLFFVGPDEVMTDNEDLKRLMESFSFKASAI